MKIYIGRKNRNRLIGGWPLERVLKNLGVRFACRMHGVQYYEDIDGSLITEDELQIVDVPGGSSRELYDDEKYSVTATATKVVPLRSTSLTEAATTGVTSSPKQQARKFFLF